MNYAASINNDPLSEAVTKGADNLQRAANMAARYGECNEVVTIVGPRGGISRWRITGTGITRNAYRISA